MENLPLQVTGELLLKLHSKIKKSFIPEVTL